MVAKGIKIVLLLIYVVFAILQWNDPDPYFWIFIYGLTALLFVLHLMGRQSRIVLGICILAGIILSFTYMGGVLDYFSAGELGSITDKMHYDRPYIELTREFFGLWIALGGLIFLFFSKPG